MKTFSFIKNDFELQEIDNFYIIGNFTGQVVVKFNKELFELINDNHFIILVLKGNEI